MQPRRRVVTPPAVLHTLSAGLTAWGVTGLKAYATTPKGACFIAVLFDTGTGLPFFGSERAGS